VAEVRTIAVIGAGMMGRSIAHLTAIGGYRTILEDLLPNALRRAESELRTSLDQAVKSGSVSSDAADNAFSRLEFAGSVEGAAREADLVIESVPEEMESKVEIFTLLDKICRPDTIIVANISELSITEIASVTYRARKCLGMRFPGPRDKAKRLEIIRGMETDDETVAAVMEVGRRMGMEIAVSKDALVEVVVPGRARDK
jgi:3-hydroxybutyryl-CoA dehydrogenase